MILKQFILKGIGRILPQFEDFYQNEREILYVSTIHKAKGREFDTVYMLLQNSIANTDEKKRALYVGMTRAKSALYIHCNTDTFNGISVPGLKHINDPTNYVEPDELLVQLTHKDVYLDFFKQRQDLIMKLRSGQALLVSGSSLDVQIAGKQLPVASFSKAFKERLARWNSQGYFPIAAAVQFVVAWKGQEDNRESFIVLPSVKLKKKSSQERGC